MKHATQLIAEAQNVALDLPTSSETRLTLDALNVADGIAGRMFFRSWSAHSNSEVLPDPAIRRIVALSRDARPMDPVHAASVLYGRPGIVHLAESLSPGAYGECITALLHDVPELSEVYFGQAGLLLSAALLLRRSPQQEISRAGQHLASRLQNELRSLANGVPHGFFLGMAHGLAGMIYACLAFSRVAAAEIDDEAVIACLDFLQQLSLDAGYYTTPSRYKVDLGGDTGLCNGSAGHLLLWCEARFRYGDRYEETLRFFANAVGGPPYPDNESICCGLAGRSLALLQYFQLTADDETLARAAQLAEAACFVALQKPRFWSLYRGGLGAAYSALAIQNPLQSTLPLLSIPFAKA